MSSRELYAQQKAMISAKAELNASANEFMSKCDAAATRAGTILTYCAGCSDTNLRDSADNSGAVGKLVSGIKGVKDRVSNALNIANAKIDQEIERLGREAAAAAQREAQQLAMQKKKQEAKDK